MSTVANEHIGDNLSTYEAQNSNISTTNVNVNDLNNRLLSIINQQLDNAQQCKSIFSQNSFQPVIYQVLGEIKNKTGRISFITKLVKEKYAYFISVLNTRQLPNFDDHLSEQLRRVDNMLIAEGISDQYSSIKPFDSNNLVGHLNYQRKLSQIRQIYNSEFEKYDNHCNDFCSHVVTLLREQSQIRPITEQEIEQMIRIIRKKFSVIQLQLKQSTCEAVMLLRSRFLDARLEILV